MPLVRIDLPDSTPTADISNVSTLVHQAMVNTFNVPQTDRFQTITRRRADELICSQEFLGIAHSANVIFVQIFCAPGRTVEMKKALYFEITQQIAQNSSFKAADVIINLSETSRENWSFGNGIAQYVN